MRSALSPRALALLFGAALLGGSLAIWLAPLMRGRTAEVRAQVVVELRTDTASIAQIYFDSGSGFNEPESAQASLPAGDVRVLTFPVRSRVLKAMRLDPLRCGGVVEVMSWHLEVDDGRGRLELPVSALKPAFQIESAEIRDDALHVVIPASANDPQLLFAPNEPLVVPQTRFPWLGLVASVAAVAMIVSARAAWRDALPILPAWALVVVVAAVAGFMLYPLHRVLDYPLWDEANYLGWGRASWSTHDLGGISGAPIYLLWYGVVTSVLPGAMPVFVTHYVLKIAIVIMVALLAGRWFESTWAGLCSGVVAALSLWNLTFPLLVYQAAWIWFLIAILAADRSRLGAVGFLALAALTRLEYVFALGAFGAVVLLALARMRSLAKLTGADFRGGWAWLVPLVLAAGVAAHVHGWNPGTARSWFAFQQHYALGRVESGQDRGVDPMIEYTRIVGRDFPGASSIRQAYAINPSEVRAHLLRNIAFGPPRIAEFFATTHGGAAAWWLGIAGLGASVIVGVVAGSNEGAGFASFFARHRWSFACALSGCVAVVPGLVIYAKTAYLLPVVPLVWLLAAMLAAGLRARQSNGLFSGLGIASILAGSFAVAICTAPRPYAGHLVVRPVHDGVDAIRSAYPTGATILGVSASSYAQYLGPAYRGIEPLASVSGDASASAAMLSELVERHRPDVILVTATWSSLQSFDSAGLRSLEAAGWRRVALPDGAFYVAPGSTSRSP